MILTLPRGNAKLPPQASPAHSGTCQHGLCCHTQVVHQFGCACMEAPKTNSSSQCSHHIAHILPQLPVPLWGFSTSLVNILADLLVAFSFSLCRPQLLYHENETRGNVSKCFKVLKRRTYTAYTLDKMRTLVWFFTALRRCLDLLLKQSGKYSTHRSAITRSIKSTSCAVLSSPSETQTLTVLFSIICHLLTYPHPLTNKISSIAVQVAASPR